MSEAGASAELVQLLRRHLDLDELVRMAQALVRLDSSNPPGDEAAAARWVADRMRQLGFSDVRLVEPRPGRASAVGRLVGQGGPGNRALLWNGHIDVVPAGDPAGWRHPPFAGVVADGRLWGRGAADMKGAVTALLEAVATLQRAGVRLQGDLVVHAVADEEMLGELGTRHLVASGEARADAAVCGEPTGLRPLVACRGILWVRITARGRSCHASTPHLGINAISQMGRVIQALDGLRWSARHPLLGPPTLSVGTIAGGTKTNVVPDRCTITVDRRLLPGETARQALEELRQVLRGLQAADPRLDVELEVLEQAEPSEISPAEPIVQAALRARRLVGLDDDGVGGMVATTDARFLINDAGIPTVILGPGRLEQAHTVDESVALDELEAGALLYAALMCEYLGATFS